MQGKFRFPLDGVDATARQFAGIRRQLMELPAGIVAGVKRLAGRVASLEAGFASLTNDRSSTGNDGDDVVVCPAHGGTGVRNVFDRPLSLSHRKTVYCMYDGTFGTDCSSKRSVMDVVDADELIPVDGLRRLKWRVWRFKDDVNQRFDDAQPAVGFLAEDLEDAGLGFFCEYDDDGDVVGVDYPKLSVAVLRLAQQAMDEVDALRGEVESLSARVDRMGGSVSKDLIVRDDHE